MRLIVYTILMVLAATTPLTSCKKGQAKFKLTGVISDGSFGTTLNNATVALYKIPAGGGTPEFIESLVSSDGSYYFEFEKDRSESYEIHITKDNYFDFVGEIFFSEMSIKTETVKNYTVYAESWAKLHFVNNNPQPTSSWPLHQLKIIDEAGNEKELEIPFTFADQAILNPAFHHYYLPVNSSYWGEDLIPLTIHVKNY